MKDLYEGKELRFEWECDWRVWAVGLMFGRGMVIVLLGPVGVTVVWT